MGIVENLDRIRNSAHAMGWCDEGSHEQLPFLFEIIAAATDAARQLTERQGSE